MRGRLLAGAVLLATAVPAAPATAHDFDVDVLSSRADQVSGGDALVRVEGPRGRLDDVRVLRNGSDVTDAFERDDGALVGLVDGLRLGRNRISVYDRRRRVASARLKNHPIEGPIFSGPHQRPFVCKTIQAGLGEPLVDNLDGDGFRVLAPDGSTAGWSRNCSANTTVDWLYRSTAGGNLRPLPAGPLPADVATATTLDGRTVPFVVRRERGTINRFIYSLAMLADPAAGDTDTSRWNRRLVYFFDGGVAIGRNQGTPGGSATNPDLLARGYAIAHSSGTRASVHYNMVLGGETALMTKERFVERYGVPLYTVGIGGSGGAIQQYLYGQNHPGLLDGAIPTHSYPDMVTQTIQSATASCSSATWTSPTPRTRSGACWDQREWLIGLNASDTFPNPYTRPSGQHRMRQRLARPDPAGHEPAVRDRRCGHRADGPGRDGRRALDALGGRQERLRRRARRLRAADVGQRRRPVRPEGAHRRQHHAGRVPASSTPRPARGRTPARWSRRARRSCRAGRSTRGVSATSAPEIRRRAARARSRR